MAAKTHALLTVKRMRVGDYSTLLQKHHVSFAEAGPYYLRAGTMTGVQGWILHVSAIQTHFETLLDTLLPVLVKARVPFKVVRNESIAQSLLQGQLGAGRIGKLLCLYPPTTAAAVTLAPVLVAYSLPFRGPAVPTDAPLGGTVYTRYGSFHATVENSLTGSPEKYWYDGLGHLIPDHYRTPFRMPRGIAWPFHPIARPSRLPSGDQVRLLKDAYLVTRRLHTEITGYVFKARRLKSLRLPWCILKEGRCDVLADADERDVQERLQWQFTLHRTLHATLPVARAYDLFRVHKNTYLVLEYIHGRTFRALVAACYQGRSWRRLPAETQVLLIDALLKIIHLVHQLHTLGYIHRGIHPDQFMVNGRGQWIMTDLEVAYHHAVQLPAPPYTPIPSPFSAPEQQAALSAPPTPHEDVYSLGMMMVVAFTNLPADRFAASWPDPLEDKLMFFMNDQPMAQCISQCLQVDPDQRPDLASLEAALQNFQITLAHSLQQEDRPWYQPCPDPSAESLQHTIRQALRALNHPHLGDVQDGWRLPPALADDTTAGALLPSWHLGLYSGAAGVLCTLAEARHAGQDITPVMRAAMTNYHKIQRRFLSALPTISGGLYHGSAGVAVALSMAMQNGLLAHTLQTRKAMLKCLQLPTFGPTLAHGAAGQGMAILQCRPFIQEGVAYTMLEQRVHYLLKTQRRDGSWSWCGEKYTGLSFGTAGIALFLLSFYAHYQENDIHTAATHALEWLRYRMQCTRRGYCWPISHKQSGVHAGLSRGMAGIALCFLRAYQICHQPAYRVIAERAMDYFDPYLITQDLTLAHGLAGLGDVYLEAYALLEDAHWLHRANWIAEVFIHTCCSLPDGAGHWPGPYADLMTGHSGILHFLLRRSALDTISMSMRL